MKYPKPLISFRRLQGGQFGTLDVSALSANSVQLALGSDYIALTRAQWLSLRTVIDKEFGTERETVILTDSEGEPIVFEEEEEEIDEDATVDNSVIVTPPPAPAKKARRRAATA